MSIDLRYLLPAICPLLIVSVIRLTAFIASANWTPGVAMHATAASCLLGIVGGAALAVTLFTEGIEIGKIALWKRDDATT